MGKSALERLFDEVQHEPELRSNYSVEDQIASADSNLELLSEDARRALDERIEKLTVENLEPEIEDTVSSEDSMPVEDQISEDRPPEKRRRGRPRKNPIDSEDSTASKSTVSSGEAPELSEFMDSLVLDLIEELRSREYRTRNFSQDQMYTILDYIEQKFS